RQEILIYYREIPEETISVVYPGVSPIPIITDPRALATTRNVFGLHATDRVILFAGRLEKRKGLKPLLYAFREIRKKERATLVIIGVGDQRPWKRLCSKLGVSADVVFTGYVDRGTYLALVSLARVYVQPSMMEGFGLGAAEA